MAWRHHKQSGQEDEDKRDGKKRRRDNDNEEEALGASPDQFKDVVTGKVYGRNRLSWILHKNDLALTRATDCQETLHQFNFRESDDRRFKLEIFQYLEDDDFLPVRIRDDDLGKYFVPGHLPKADQSRTEIRFDDSNRFLSGELERI